MTDYILSNLLKKAAERFPDRTAIYFKGLEMTFSELDKKASRFASGLLNNGIKKGDRVGLYMPNYPEWIIAFFGIARMGGVVVPMNTRYKAKEVDYIMNNSEATSLVMTSDFMNLDYITILDSLRGKIPELKKVIVLGDRVLSGMTAFDEILEAGSDHAHDQALEDAILTAKEDDAVFILYTSGTTGEPKGAMLTNLNISKNAAQIAEVLEQNENDNTLIVVPFFHCFGCVIALSASVHAGSGVIPMPAFDAKASLEAMERYRISIVHGVPTMFINYLDVLKNKDFDLDAVRTGVMAGAPCPIEVMKGAIDKMGANISIAYGLTEASPVITMTRLDDSLEDRVETVGRALPEQEIKIIDEHGKELPLDKTGELVSRGYNIMKGYFKMPEQTSEAIDVDGWLHSGDLATMDDRGYIRIVGRKKEMYISGGFNVYPREIEEFLFTLPYVDNVSVIGVPDKRLGEAGMAVIKLKNGHNATKEELISHCKENIANFKVPKFVWFVDEYPMTESGKIQKFKLRDMAVEEFKLE